MKKMKNLMKCKIKKSMEKKTGIKELKEEKI